MNKTLTFLSVTAVTALCAGYLFMDHNTDERFQDLSSKVDNTEALKPTLPSAFSEQEFAFDQSESSENLDEASDSNLKPLIRHYSHTFLTTQAYESASQFGKLPANMSDVRIEELPFDEQGQLIIDDKVKQLIEFFLLAKDVEGLDQAIERLYEYLDMTLPSPANEQARALAEQYLSYKEQLNNKQFADNTNLNDESNLADIKHALADRKKLRREILGEENSQAIFGYEERYEDFSFKRLEINANHELSKDEKDRLIAQAEQSLPEKLADKMRYQRESKNLESKIADLKQSAGNEAEIFQLRKDFYGEKVAERLAYLEDQSPAWQQRVNDFYMEQQAIQNNTSLSNEQKKQEIKALKNQSFTYKEQVKLAVQYIRG